MAITKRFKASVDVKIVLPTEDIEHFTKNLIKMTKAYSLGDKLSGEDVALVKAALVGGPEAAIEQRIKSMTAKLLKETFLDAETKPGNVAVRILK